MKLINPCSQCFVMPMCRELCIDKAQYDQAIDIRSKRRWEKFFMIITGIGFIEVIIALILGMNELYNMVGTLK